MYICDMHSDADGDTIVNCRDSNGDHELSSSAQCGTANPSSSSTSSSSSPSSSIVNTESSSSNDANIHIDGTHHLAHHRRIANPAISTTTMMIISMIAIVMTSLNGITVMADATNTTTSTSSPLVPMHMVDGCLPVHFLVTIFGGDIDGLTGGNSTMGETSSYHTASDDAHIILGVLLLCMVLSWSCFVLDILRVRASSFMSGLFQLSMGLYLHSWLFFFMTNGNDLLLLFDYSTRDMLQLQHVGIASLLVAGGCIEMMQASQWLPPMVYATTKMPLRASATTTSNGTSSSSSPSASSSMMSDVRLKSGSVWHQLWSINLIFTGLIFMLHPQHTYNATIKHLLLGASLIVGAPLCIRAKARAWEYELDLNRRARLATIGIAGGARDNIGANHVDWSMIAAGGCFTFAACVLLAFREQESAVHVGTTIECQPSFVICAISYAIAGGSLLSAIMMSCKHKCNRSLSGSNDASSSSLSSTRSSSPAPIDSASSSSRCSCILRLWRRSSGGWSRILQSDVVNRRIQTVDIDLDLDGDDRHDVDENIASSSSSRTKSINNASDVSMTRLGSATDNRIDMTANGHSHTLGELDDYDEEPNFLDEEEDVEREKRRDHRRQEDYHE